MLQITVQFTLGKILERVGDTLDNRQYGALKQRSTIHALVDMLHHWHTAMDSDHSVRIMLLTKVRHLTVSTTTY